MLRMLSLSKRIIINSEIIIKIRNQGFSFKILDIIKFNYFYTII